MFSFIFYPKFVWQFCTVTEVKDSMTGKIKRVDVSMITDVCTSVSISFLTKENYKILSK
jgi:hypothetical protein